MVQEKNNNKEVLAIIPARGGSKGIPKKNIVDLCGKPLIAYTLEVALKSTLITKVIVSTDDEEIESISREWGAEVPFLRPKSISSDRSLIRDTISYTLNELNKKGYNPDIIVSLYPTHLFRTISMVNFCVGKLLEGHIKLYSVKKIEHNKRSIFSKNSNNRLEPILSTPEKEIYNSPFCRQYGIFIGRNTEGHKSPYLYHLENPITLIDIDTQRDLYLAEEIIKRDLFNFND